MAKFLISYTIDASTSVFQKVLNTKMREEFEKQSHFKELDHTQWYLKIDSNSKSVCNNIIAKFNKLKQEVKDYNAKIYVSVNEVSDWSMLNYRDVANWLNSN